MCGRVPRYEEVRADAIVPGDVVALKTKPGAGSGYPRQMLVVGVSETHDGRPSLSYFGDNGPWCGVLYAANEMLTVVRPERGEA